MKRFLPLLVLLIAVGYVAAKWRAAAPQDGFDLAAFGRLPVLVGGRVKPLDTVARTSLLVLQGRQRVSDPTLPVPFVNSPAEWLADVLFAPAKADTYPTFRISASDAPELLTLMGLTEDVVKIRYTDPVKRALTIFDFLPSARSRFSFAQLEPKLAELDRQAKLAEPIEDQLRSPFQKQVIRLRDTIVLYQRLKHSAQSPDSPNFLDELVQFQKALPAGIEAVRARQKGEPHDETAFKAMMGMTERYDFMDKLGYLLAIPPADSEPSPTAWKTAGHALLETFETGSVDANVMAYAALGHAWRHHDPAQFNEVVRLYREHLVKRFGPQLQKSDVEARFNAAEPFYGSMVLYAFAFLLAVFSWLLWPDVLGKSAFYLVGLAWLLSTAGIATRMWLESRPPVTNLYSSALFVGWGAVALCLGLEKIYRNAIGSVAAGVVGFITLLIAHHLSLSGDTLEMMRAVLDTNLWLATHVVVVTTGYSATFLAGFLALIYIVRGLFTTSLDKATADSLARMVYGVVCFATLCSLVGTVLGGIWADQSWGRFWGWDPKENGALIIVIWNAIILHARWGGLIKQRGLMCLAVFGNVVTSWSWFGVNMLGVGLHSYGFMEAAFWWLVLFVSTQFAFILLANLPLSKWRSFQAD
jgi:ABC-type transport system involved in cytochrome c biogenesis permease subunit